MATKGDFDSIVGKLNTATNAVAARIQKYIDKVSAGGITAADEDKAIADLQAAADTLTAMGADPADPIPAPVEPGGGTGGTTPGNEGGQPA